PINFADANRYWSVVPRYPTRLRHDPFQFQSRRYRSDNIHASRPCTRENTRRPFAADRRVIAASLSIRRARVGAREARGEGGRRIQGRRGRSNGRVRGSRLPRGVAVHTMPVPSPGESFRRDRFPCEGFSWLIPPIGSVDYHVRVTGLSWKETRSSVTSVSCEQFAVRHVVNDFGCGNSRGFRFLFTDRRVRMNLFW